MLKLSRHLFRHLEIMLKLSRHLSNHLEIISEEKNVGKIEKKIGKKWEPSHHKVGPHTLKTQHATLKPYCDSHDILGNCK
jgi:hypothetical protein